MTSPTQPLWRLNPEPWLCQGDLFRTAPVVITTVTGERPEDANAKIAHVPALLATFDCALDKTNKRSEMLATEMTFLPLRQLAVLEGNKQAIIRRNTITPYDFFYVGDLPDLGESYVSLNNPSTFTVGYFAAELRVFDGDPEAHLVATRHDERLGTLGAQQLVLFKDKWNAHWTRRLPERAPTP